MKRCQRGNLRFYLAAAYAHERRKTEIDGRERVSRKKYAALRGKNAKNTGFFVFNAI